MLDRISWKKECLDNNTTLYCGDCLEVLDEIPENSVDLVVTDPPYHLGFMGKDWDKDNDFTEIWRKMQRVMKDGAFAFILTSPRQDLMSERIVELRDAGFNVKFSPVFWTYAKGFPKAHNVAKALDKKEGKDRRVICRNPNSRESCSKDNTIYRSGTVGKTDYITVGDSPLEGAYAGFQPKPAVEVVVVAMKPLKEKTHEAQALTNRMGVTWLDDCRIPYRVDQPAHGSNRGTAQAETRSAGNGSPAWLPVQSGRFPGNLLVSAGILGDFSKFFSLDAWARHLPFLVVPKAGKREKCLGLGGRDPHPTAKPVDLMGYLIVLGSRPGDTVLDPFQGLGTTGIAARRLGRPYIGIERDEGYFADALQHMRASMK